MKTRLIILTAAVLLGTSALARADNYSSGESNVIAPTDHTGLIEKTWDQGDVSQIKPAAGDPTPFHDLRNGLSATTMVNNNTLDTRFSEQALTGGIVTDENANADATIADVIVDNLGNAQHVVLTEADTVSGVPESGRHQVVMNYTDVVNVTAAADSPTILHFVNVQRLKEAPAYNGPGSGETPASLLLGTNVKDVDGNQLARVDNLVFDRSAESYVILSYTEGGNSGHALMDYKDLKKVYVDKGVYIELSPEQAAFFKSAILGQPK